jgi:translation initiation factor 1 (eIF-1/SUI1)
MNPFEENIPIENTYIPKVSDTIEIWLEERGRKSDTFISGLPLSEAELNTHLKIIKKKKGCNGSVKESISDDGTTKLLIHFQGNKKDYIKEYFIDLGYNNIKLKG